MMDVQKGTSLLDSPPLPPWSRTSYSLGSFRLRRYPWVALAQKCQALPGPDPHMVVAMPNLKLNLELHLPQKLDLLPKPIPPPRPNQHQLLQTPLNTPMWTQTAIGLDLMISTGVILGVISIGTECDGGDGRVQPFPEPKKELGI